MTTYSKPAMELKVERAVQDTKYLMREEIFRLRADFNDCNEVRAHWHKEAERLRASNAELVATLTDCANDLEASVKAEYTGMLDYPSMKRKYDRDLEPVVRARAAIAKAKAEPKIEPQNYKIQPPTFVPKG